MNTNNRYERCRRAIYDEVRGKIDLSREVTDDEVQEMIDDRVVGIGRSNALSLKERQELGRSVFHSIRKMDVLQELVESDDVTEIMINGTDNIFVEKAGRLPSGKKDLKQEKSWKM